MLSSLKTEEFGGIIAFIEQTIDAFKDNEVFAVRFIEKNVSIATFNLNWVKKLSRSQISLHNDVRSENFLKKSVEVGEIHFEQGILEIFFIHEVKTTFRGDYSRKNALKIEKMTISTYMEFVSRRDAIFL